MEQFNKMLFQKLARIMKPKRYISYIAIVLQASCFSISAQTLPPADPPPPPVSTQLSTTTSAGPQELPPTNIPPAPQSSAAAVSTSQQLPPTNIPPAPQSSAAAVSTSQQLPPTYIPPAPQSSAAAVSTSQQLPPTAIPSPQSTNFNQMSSDQFKTWLAANGFNTSANTQGSYPSQLAQPASTPGTDRAPPASPGPPKSPQRMTYEEELNAMLNQLPPNAPKPSADSMAAFNMLLQQNVPLTPLQVLLLRQHIDMSQRAASIPATIPPKPVSSTLMVNLSPGTTPPVIRLSQGYVTSLVFVDSTGTAWPIAQFDIGNPKAVNIQWDGKSNIILLQAIAPYSNGDIVIRLAGLPTPITLELVSGQRVVDYRVDLHVPGIGPNTKEIPLGTALPNSASDLLLDVLNGIAPPGSRVLIVRGADAIAWTLGDRLYLRTRFTVLSPGWMGKMTSADGMQAYELPKTSSVLISRYGEPAELKIEGL